MAKSKYDEWQTEQPNSVPFSPNIPGTQTPTPTQPRTQTPTSGIGGYVSPTQTNLAPGPIAPVGTPPTIPTHGPGGINFPVPGRPPYQDRTKLYNPFDRQSGTDSMTGETGPPQTPYRAGEITLPSSRSQLIRSTGQFDPTSMTITPEMKDQPDIRYGRPDLNEIMTDKFPGYTNVDTETQPEVTVTPDRPQQIQDTYQPPKDFGPDKTDPDLYRRGTEPVGVEQPGTTGNAEFDALVLKKHIEALTGDSPELQAMTKTHDRDVARLSADGLAEARAIAASRGYPPGSEQYNQVMRSAQQQINDATLGSEQKLFSSIRQQRQDALRNATTLSDNLWGRGQDLWDRKMESERNTKEEMTNLINTIPHQGIRNILATFGTDVDGAREWLKSGVLLPSGKPNDKFVDSDYEVLQAKVGDLLRAENTAIAEKYINPETEEFDQAGFLADPAIKDKVGPQIAKVWEAQAGPVDTAAQDIELKRTIENTVQAVLDGDKQLKDITPKEWAQMNDNQRNKLNVPQFNPSTSKFRTITELLKSNMKVDVVESSVNDGAHTRNENSAGEGNGDIVMYNNVPYRLTRFWTKKDTTGRDERNGRLYGVPLDGSSNQETLLSESGFQR